MEEYRAALNEAIGRAYSVATAARRLGLDPELFPEVPPAEDMAMRVEKLLGHLKLDGISTEIRALCAEMPREEVAMTIARRLANDTSKGRSLEARIDAALRVGLAVLTEGILVAPLEGLAEVHLRPAKGGSAYIELYYAGPIRAAGGTAQALSVLLADVLRLGTWAWPRTSRRRRRSAGTRRRSRSTSISSTCSTSRPPRRSTSSPGTSPCASPARPPKGTPR